MHDGDDQEEHPEQDAVSAERVRDGQRGDEHAAIATSIAPQTAPTSGSTVFVNQA